MFTTLSDIGRRFGLPGILENYEQIKNGNINKTYKVSFITPEEKRKYYVFQLVNTYVFKNPAEIMKNIDLVTSHIREKNKNGTVLCYYSTEKGENYVAYGEDGFWRVMNYIDSITFSETSDLGVIRSAGRAFGSFQNQLADFDGSRLYETIKDFHNTGKRIADLFVNARNNPLGRAESAEKELEYIASVAERASELSRRYENGEFPVRVTHNDTKANNVLFERKTLEPLAVIDLDTVMPGMAMYDFGDGARFIASSAPEDEEDTEKVWLDEEKFAAFSRGFIGEIKGRLTPTELELMVLGTFSVTVELASRFLNDYLCGDLYFKTTRPHHNLIRAKCQLTLAKDIIKKYEELQDIVRDCAR